MPAPVSCSPTCAAPEFKVRVNPETEALMLEGVAAFWVMVTPVVESRTSMAVSAPKTENRLLDGSVLAEIEPLLVMLPRAPE